MANTEFNIIKESLRDNRLYDALTKAEKFISMDHPDNQKSSIIEEFSQYWEELQWFFSYFRFPMIEKRLRTGNLPLEYKMLREFYIKYSNK